MYFSAYSLAAAVLWATVFIKLISLARKRLLVSRYFSLSPFLFALLLCILRIVIPIELPFTANADSRRFLPLIQKFSRKRLFCIGTLEITPAIFTVAVWALGAAAIIFRQARDYCRFRHLLDQIPASEDGRLYHFLAKADTQGRLRNAKIIVHRSILAPAVVGCIRPVIVLPDMHFDDDGLLGILIHETTHFSCGHHLVGLAVGLACACFWWNPFLKGLSLETAHALEMHADRAVCERLRQDQQARYLGAIARVYNSMCQAVFTSAFSCSLLGKQDASNLQQRFQMILGNHYQEKKKRGLAVMPLALFIFLLSYAVVPQPYSEPTREDFGDCEVAPDGKYYCIEIGGGYDLYEYPEQFIVHMDHMQEHMQWLRVYQKKEDAQKWKEEHP